MNWKIHQVTMPESLAAQKDVIRQLISEALQEYGFVFRKQDISQINVTISPQILVYKEILSCLLKI